MMKAFMFPGQGSQRRGMGQELFDSVEQFTSIERQIDAILGYSVRTLCLENPENRLSQTQYTQPALYIVNALHYFAKIEKGIQADCVIGHSLGEYNALLAAGAIDFMTGLRLVQKRGALMARAQAGGMAAVIGLAPERIQAVFRGRGFGSLDVANFNSPAQTVISGPAEEIKQVGPHMLAAGATHYMPLPVSAAFHSRYMKLAAQEFEGYLMSFHFQPLQLPVISNVTARPYPAGSDIKHLLVRQISSPVQWMQSIGYLREQGCMDFEEVGPGNVLTKLAQQIGVMPVHALPRLNQPILPQSAAS